MTTTLSFDVRFAAPGPEPLGVACDSDTLWVSSREGHRLYALDPVSFAVREVFEAPGAPFGIAIAKDGLRVIVGFGHDDDDRYIYRFDRKRGFSDDRIECPDRSGVQLAFDGDELLLAQAHNRRILALGAGGEIRRTIALERVPVGIAFVDRTLHLITCDRSFGDPMFGTLEDPIASLPFGARALAFDGARFWTSDRRKDEIVAFTIERQR